MPDNLRSTILEFLSKLDQTQDELLTLGEQKTAALRGSDAIAIREISTHEKKLTWEMQRLLSERARIIQQASAESNQPFTSIEQYINSLNEETVQHILPLIKRSISKSETIRRESWVHWIIAHRAYQHYSELIDIIAHCGEKAPTYSEGLVEDISGSALLDTSA